MKKLLIVITVVLLLMLAAVYLFIPGTLTVSDVVTVQCSINGANRVLTQKESWSKLWVGQKVLTPGNELSDNDLFIAGGDTFRITRILPNALGITIANGNVQEKSTLLMLPLKQDSIALNWSYTTTTAANPITRVQQYQQAANTKKTMEAVTQNIRKYLSSNEHVYGIHIAQTTTVDTTLISTYATINQYPTTEVIYGLVSKLQAYIAKNKAIQTGSPMLNITPIDSNQYKVMVALPTNKQLSEQGDISYKKMIPGRFLTTTVTGGRSTIDRAHEQMQYFFRDYRRTAMAIPFQVLITDRTRQTDTTKWITQLYFPVM